MVPELYPILSRLFVSTTDDEQSTYPSETSTSELVTNTFLPREGWKDLVAVTPVAAALGTVGRQAVRLDRQRFVFHAKIPFDSRWPDLGFGDPKDLPFAILQKKDVLTAHIFMGSMVGANVSFKEDSWEGQIVIEAARIKRLLDMVV